MIFFFISLKFSFADSARDKAIEETLQSGQEKREQAMRDAFQEAQMNYVRDEIVSGERMLRPVFEVQPYFDVGLKYDDNIFLSNTDLQEDFIKTLSAGFNVTIGGAFEENMFADLQFVPALRFNLGTQIVDYTHHKELNIKPFANFNGNFVPNVHLEYNLGKRKNKLNLAYTLQPGYVSVSSFQIGGVGQVNYFSDQFTADWEQTFRRLGYHIGLRRTTTNYQSTYSSNNSEDDMGTLTAFFQATPKTRFFTELDYGITKYVDANTDSNNSNNTQVWVGTSGRLAPKVIGSAKIGFVRREYENGKNDSGLAENINLTYRNSPKLSFTFRALNEANQGNYFSEGFAKTFKISLGAKYNFNSRFSTSLKIVEFEHSKYEGGLVYDSYSPSIGFQYMFQRWINLKFEISHKERHANLQEASYKGNAYNLTASANF